MFQPPSDSWMLASVLRAERLPPGARGLDLCTGSGVLAVAAARAGCQEVLAVDISRKAVMAARLNGWLNGVGVRAMRGDLFAPVAGQRFDLIVCNPPYLPSPDDELPTTGIARAWEAGPDGRAFLDRICASAGDHLRPGGVLLLVHSSVCGERETIDALRRRGLEPSVALRHHGPLGPILAGRAGWLERKGMLQADGGEDMLVIRGRAPVADEVGGPGHEAGAAQEPAPAPAVGGWSQPRPEP